MRLAAIALSDMTEEMKAFHLRWSKWRRKHQATVYPGGTTGSTVRAESGANFLFEKATVSNIGTVATRLELPQPAVIAKTRNVRR